VGVDNSTLNGVNWGTDISVLGVIFSDGSPITFDATTGTVDNYNDIFTNTYSMRYEVDVDCSGETEVCFLDTAGAQPTSSAANCSSANSMTNTCFSVHAAALRQTRNVLPFYGPFNLKLNGKIIEFSCSPTDCIFYSNLVPGLIPAANYRYTMFMFPNGNAPNDNDDITTCSKWENDTSILREDMVFGTHTSGNLDNTIGYDYEYIACPYIQVAGEKKYFGITARAQSL